MSFRRQMNESVFGFSTREHFLLLPQAFRHSLLRHQILLKGIASAKRMTMDDGTFAPLLTLLDDPMFYDLSRQVHDAKRVFDGLCGSKDLISWNAMIAGFSKHEQKESAFELFIEMQRIWIETDVYTYTSVLSCCSGEEHRIFGKSLHCLVIKKGLEQVTSASNALISMYIQFPTSAMREALSLFESLESKDTVSWNSIMTGLSQKGLSEDAVKFFSCLRSSNIEVDDYAFSAVLRSCSDLATHQLVL
ncbi:unnamed protein product [Thlaspi arvense]|uniref:Pentatricopeptide repeat-containing protein n=1 Tax=Thlaspi arvense TaxID=13288 RepID=A0AAU9RLU6_THLAR|nr:unnamed protein product [Thlaspi arvense]